jgi:hypothetical protein
MKSSFGFQFNELRKYNNFYRNFSMLSNLIAFENEFILRTRIYAPNKLIEQFLFYFK